MSTLTNLTGDSSVYLAWPPEPNRGVMAASIFLTVVAVVTNFVLIYSIWTNKKLMETTSNYLVLALSVSDFIFMFMSGVTLAANYRSPTRAVCLVQGFFTHALAGTSILLLILVTYERYTLLVLDKRMSKARALKLIALVYGVGVVYGLPPLLGLGHYDLSGGTLCIARGGRGVLTDNIYTAGGMLIIFFSFLRW